VAEGEAPLISVDCTLAFLTDVNGFLDPSREAVRFPVREPDRLARWIKEASFLVVFVVKVISKWLSSYLSSRSFCVKCNNELSSCHTSCCGVPQGSVLGPLLFILYTTPLSTLI